MPKFVVENTLFQKASGKHLRRNFRGNFLWFIYFIGIGL